MKRAHNGQRRTQTGPIGIIGDGIVGGTLRAFLEERGHDIRLYDPPKGHAAIEALDEADIVFVCVPTPYTPGHGFDDQHLLSAISSLRHGHVVVIKSTVLPGTTQMLQERLPQHRFLFNPEFLREATAHDDFIHPDRQIVGHTATSACDAEEVMALLPRAPFELVCHSGDAELAKYAANSFLAVKVSFANEIFDLCARLQLDYQTVRDIVAADVRIGGSHMDVLDSGYRGYGGKCLPKDSKALLDLARSVAIELQVLHAADRVNAALRGQTAGERVTGLTALGRRDVAAERAA